MGRLLTVLLVFCSLALAAGSRKPADAKSAEETIKACEYDAKVKQFDCLEEPPPHTECFLRVMDLYDACCRNKGVKCPALKF